jgi:hypothetical protein
MSLSGRRGSKSSLHRGREGGRVCEWVEGERKGGREGEVPLPMASVLGEASSSSRA